MGFKGCGELQSSLVYVMVLPFIMYKKKKNSLRATIYRDEDIYTLDRGGGCCCRCSNYQAFIVTLVYITCPNYLAALQLLERRTTLKGASRATADRLASETVS